MTVYHDSTGVPECRHCGETFEDEADLATHLTERHEAALSRLDRRRAEAARDADAEGTDGDASTTGRVLRVAVPVVLGVVVAGFLYVLLAPGGSPAETGAASQPTDLYAVHYHGTMEVAVLGDRIDLSRDRYQLRADAFHFERNRGERWHVHARGVTLEWALESLGMDATTDSVTVGGATYRDGEAGHDVRILVNGEPVDPRSYVLEQGDAVRVLVTEPEP